MQICLMFLVITDDSIVWMYVTFQNENVYVTFQNENVSKHFPICGQETTVHFTEGVKTWS